MPRNQPRLQLALYARSKYPDAPHFAIFIAPKKGGKATKHHAKNTILSIPGQISQPWRYERVDIPDVTLEQHLLVRVIIGKVTTSLDQVDEILKGIPVYQVDDPDRAKAESFNCRAWAGVALEELKKQGAVTMLEGDWAEIERRAKEYLGKKREQGRWSKDWKGQPGVPLMDLIEGRELVA
ncbi:hypothetical protein M409DRAFT_30890 [Zasmidium cellare ATCC 36951]|uniref:Uncharacterized protein n=1 Tax=Zasmidium cellare ATCC 36951 TaxID=1080233 RepID=A0A6A6BXE5_ZASCE|nr:uncharacterized protein M409DRAFT_30890 [Zasmidium cellare ATCC 36951]KAF2158610.1 hypothetical protein M409DRAFT_30890 [Zasmidium cellare ATCC 36951]